MAIKAVIVDDEANARENLRIMIEDHCPDIEVVATAGSAKEARKVLAKVEADALFLDIRMPGEDGFSLLRSLKEKHIAVVFTTAYDEYALQAFKANALDYLEKPIDPEELERAAAKLRKVVDGTADAPTINADVEEVVQQINGAMDDRISIPSREGIAVVKHDDILYLEASDSYTEIHLVNGKRLVSSKHIRLFEEHLSGQDFYRIHKSYIINLKHLTGFDRAEGNMAVLGEKGVLLPVSRRRMSDFLSVISTF